MTTPQSRPAPSEVPAGMASGTCHPEQCPCTTGSCTISRLAASVTDDRRSPAGQRTLHETEAAVEIRLAGLSLDLPAMAAISNLHRAAGTVRNNFERTVLAPHDLTWTGWVVLWVAWIWEEIETRHLAEEAGISKGTLTGVVKTLQGKGLVERRTHPDDGRRVLITLTPAGQELMRELFPVFNAAEVQVVAPLTAREMSVLTTALRKIVIGIEAGPADPV